MKLFIMLWIILLYPIWYLNKEGLVAFLFFLEKLVIFPLNTAATGILLDGEKPAETEL